MAVRSLTLLGIVLILGYALGRADPVSGRVIKVLPHYLDLKGRQSLSPSLFERDAYQAILRRQPERCSGMRFDVQWKAKHASEANLRLRLELLTTQHPRGTPLVIERSVRAPSGWRRWSRVYVEGDAFRQAGELLGWRLALWDGNHLLSEQQSFLW